LQKQQKYFVGFIGGISRDFRYSTCLDKLLHDFICSFSFLSALSASKKTQLSYSSGFSLEIVVLGFSNPYILESYRNSVNQVYVAEPGRRMRGSSEEAIDSTQTLNIMKPGQAHPQSVHHIKNVFAFFLQ